MKVAVGSLNPTKINAVKLAFNQVWPDEKFEFIAIDSKSGVSNQPMSDKETIKGALNRAKRALKEAKADYGVGLEGGLQKHGKIWLECGVMVVIDKAAKIGIGSSPRLMVPTKLLKMIKAGDELGTIIDIVFKTENAKHKEGFFGLMTKNHITRTEGYKQGVIMALVRFLNPELF